MNIIQGRAGVDSEQRTATFTGTVWADPILAPTDGVTINSVAFEPGARTHWHTHERGQILIVTSGQGKACTRGGEAATIRAGDVVWFAPDEEHWHGADSSSHMVHTAISLGGHEWNQPVNDSEYAGSEQR